MDPQETLLAYHHRTKHHYERHARSLGYMDWSNQPAPFRSYDGAPRTDLPLASTDDAPPYDGLWASGVPARPLTLESLAAFLEHGMALSAWKQFGESRWALRINPSSGNLHPTEAYLLAGGPLSPGLYHYAPDAHALERRAALPAGLLPEHGFFVALSSIHWREAWKYGERAFRYCQHDVGHAVAALRLSAAALGWRLRLLDGPGDEALDGLLGLDRQDGFLPEEREHGELLLAVGVAEPPALPELAPADWRGRPNRLSGEHVRWEVIEQVQQATVKPDGPPPAERFDGLPAPIRDAFPAAREEASAWRIFKQRRSAVAMDGTSALPADRFFRMLSLVCVDGERRTPPWDALPWRPRVHLGLFVHRVTGLEQGLYALVRDPAQREALRQAMRSDFEWSAVPGAPEALGLYFLAPGQMMQTAAMLSCHQEIAGDGAFSLGMIAHLRACERLGAWFYRRLFWETGVIGQVLYLEAEAAGLRGTGIGCFFDDPVHELFGLRGPDWQSLYHFTVGGPVEDERLSTLPPYGG